MFACLFRPPQFDDDQRGDRKDLMAIAAEFSPRYERHGDDLVSIDVSGLDRLLGPARAIGEELRREAARVVGVHVALARTRTTALVLALARPGLTVINPGDEAASLAVIPLGILERFDDSASSAVSRLKRWGLKTLGDLAALPSADLASRLGRSALVWQAVARGEDIRPMVPTELEERFASSLELEWPIEGLEPLSFVLTRLLEPLSTRLERRDRGAAVLHVVLRLVTHETYARHLQLPSPIRDVRTLRTLALLDLDAHPPAAAIDRVTVVIDPTPGRVLQHTLFTRAHPTPEQLSTLLARLGALMGQDRIGAPATVDSYRPGAFEMKPFATEHHSFFVGPPPHALEWLRSSSRSSADSRARVKADPTSSLQPLASALRRCRQPVPARVAFVDGRPVGVMTDRHGFAGGAVVQCAGPWRTSGNWWAGEAGRAGRVGGAGWNRDEWDVVVNNGTVYRIFCDRETDAWFIDAIVD